MKAITLKQPWAYAITDLGKNIENRNWLPMLYRSSSKGETLALHAGMSFDKEESWATILITSGVLPPSREKLITGAIVAVAEVVGWLELTCTSHCANGNIEARYFDMHPFKNYTNYGSNNYGKWFFGRYGWILANVRKLRVPIPYKGALGRWDVPEIIKTVIYEEIAR